MKGNTSRKEFIERTVKGSLGIASLPFIGNANSNQKSMDQNASKAPEVIFFDVNETLLDLTNMKESVGAALKGKNELLPLWFTTMLQYSLVDTVGNQYRNFGEVGAAALQMVARNNDIELSEQEAKEAIKPIRSLPAYPEVKKALTDLREAGYKLASLTNSSYDAVNAQLENAGIIDLFDERLSVEAIGKYKPHGDVYNWAARKMNLDAEQCMLVAAHGWDIAGAAWAGWQTGFISRPGQQLYPHADSPDIEGADLEKVAGQLIAQKKNQA